MWAKLDQREVQHWSMRERMYRLMSDLGSKAREEIRGCRVAESDFGVAPNAFMARNPHEVDAMDNFLES